MKRILITALILLLATVAIASMDMSMGLHLGSKQIGSGGDYHYLLIDGASHYLIIDGASNQLRIDGATP